MSEEIVCPVCEKADKIQKISAVHMAESGTQRVWDYDSDGDGGWYTQNVTTRLSSLLSPPVEPPASLGCYNLVGLLGGILFLVIGILVVVVVIGNAVIRGTTQGGGEAIGVGICGIFLGASSIIEVKNKRSKIPEKRELWHKAQDRWYEAYYCHRCGVVFSPSRKKYAHLDKRESFDQFLTG